jgi:hypothetical protein
MTVFGCLPRKNDVRLPAGCMKTEPVFRIVILQVPVHNHHSVLEFSADVLKDVSHPTLAGFYLPL